MLHLHTHQHLINYFPSYGNGTWYLLELCIESIFLFSYEVSNKNKISILLNYCRNRGGVCGSNNDPCGEGENVPNYQVVYDTLYMLLLILLYTLVYEIIPNFFTVFHFFLSHLSLPLSNLRIFPSKMNMFKRRYDLNWEFYKAIPLNDPDMCLEFALYIYWACSKREISNTAGNIKKLKVFARLLSKVNHKSKKY